MLSDLEQQLARLLTSQPRSTGTAEEQAREAALEVLPAAPRPRRNAAWLVLAAACAAVITAGAALAASPSGFRDLRDVVAPSPSSPPAAKHHVSVLRVPAGAAGFSVQSGGRLWVATPRGVALSGVPLSAAATSPQALYAVGERAGHLQAVSIADRHIAWSVPLNGRLAAAAWSPYPIRIAYVVTRQGSGLLHLIWGNGANDQVVGPARSVMPAWRSDSLAVAYVSPTGAVMLDSVGGAPLQINPAWVCGGYQITGLAFAPDSTTLAETTTGPRLILVDTRDPRRVSCIHTNSPSSQLHWLSPGNLVYTHLGSRRLSQIVINHQHLLGRGALIAPAAILALAVSPDGRNLAIAIRKGDQLRILTSAPPHTGETSPLRPQHRLDLNPFALYGVHIGWS